MLVICTALMPLGMSSLVATIGCASSGRAVTSVAAAGRPAYQYEQRSCRCVIALWPVLAGNGLCKCAACHRLGEYLACIAQRAARQRCRCRPGQRVLLDACHLHRPDAARDELLGCIHWLCVQRQGCGISRRCRPAGVTSTSSRRAAVCLRAGLSLQAMVCASMLLAIGSVNT